MTKEDLPKRFFVCLKLIKIYFFAKIFLFFYIITCCCIYIHILINFFCSKPKDLAFKCLFLCTKEKIKVI